MKIAINKCYGGFSLSPAAVEAMAKRKGIERLYWFNSRGFGDDAVHTPIEGTPDKDSPFVNAYTTPDPKTGEYVSSYSYTDDRSDPDLIAVIEELGPEAAGGRFSQVAVVEVPDGIGWEIGEYDGIEWIAETHRTWS